MTEIDLRLLTGQLCIVVPPYPPIFFFFFKNPKTKTPHKTQHQKQTTNPKTKQLQKSKVALSHFLPHTKNNPYPYQQA